jgi:proteic killer suppression protein
MLHQTEACPSAHRLVFSEKLYHFMIQSACGMYHKMIHTFMIKSFKNDETEAAFEGEIRKGFPADLLKIKRRKLQMTAAASVLTDLKVPPGNRLEALKGDRKGQHSIRVNDQFRICFIWTDEGARDVEFTDYH